MDWADLGWGSEFGGSFAILNLQGLITWAWLPKLKVLQNFSSTSLSLCETFRTTFLQNPKGSPEFWQTVGGSPDPSFEAQLLFLPKWPLHRPFGAPWFSSRWPSPVRSHGSSTTMMPDPAEVRTIDLCSKRSTIISEENLADVFSFFLFFSGAGER